MSSQAQIDANRLNAQKSTGPRTPEGRAAVRLNGVKHGLTAETIVLKGESQADFTNLLDSYEAEHVPASPTEEELVRQLALAAWRLRRLYHQEAGFYAFQSKDTADNTEFLELNQAERMGYVCFVSEKTLAMFNRQEARLERTFYRALHELQRLRKERLASLLQPPPIVENKENSPDSHYSPSVSEGAEPPKTSESDPPAASRPIL